MRRMSTGIDRIIEERIQTAMKEGKLSDLPGHGKPLEMEDDSGVPEDLRMAHKILKNAGCVPKELDDHVKIRQTEDLLKTTPSATEKIRAMKRIAILKTRLMKRGHHTSIFDIPEGYEEELISHLEK